MDSLQINTGEKHIPVIHNGVSTGEIVFNPSDVIFAEKFYKLIGEFETKFSEYTASAKTLLAITEKDKNGFPINNDKQIELAKEVCIYLMEKVDGLFGMGTSQIVFGNAMDLGEQDDAGKIIRNDMFSQFFMGVQPYIQRARSAKVAQYTTVASAKRNKRKR